MLQQPCGAEDAGEMVVEIYRVAPGRHLDFLRQIALYDRANVEATTAAEYLERLE